MKWIKASDRLPSNPGNPQTHWRIDGFHKVNGNFYEFTPGEIRFGVIGSTHEDYDILEKNFDKIEWLDESEEKTFTTDEVWKMYTEDEGNYSVSFSKFAELNKFVFIKLP